MVTEASKVVDRNGDGFIAAADEYGMAESTDFEEGLIDDFKALDRDGNGFITAGELRRVMKDRGEKLTYEEAGEAIRDADVDGDLQIDYEEYRDAQFNYEDEDFVDEDVTANDEGKCHEEEGEYDELEPHA